MSPFWAFFLSVAFVLFSGCKGESDDDKEVYIVYMGDLPKGDLPASAIHNTMLQAAVGSRASEALVYSYKRSFNGFAAKLTKQEKETIAKMDGVVSIFPSGVKHLHTTRSWDFVGLRDNIWRSVYESDVVIGMLDTGVWPESESFREEPDTTAPPSKFKGICQTDGNFTCNKKLIGARYYNKGGSYIEKDVPSARDMEGHGTHTASTVAGQRVSEANLFNLGKGTARGGVPSSRIAVYKICWKRDCHDVDILAAFDDAIADEVDIISLSIGAGIPIDYFDDVIAIGAFHAMRAGILVSVSGGNGGPRLGSMVNVAPWLLSVGATAIDRKFTAKAELGDHEMFKGIAVNTFDLNGQMYPLIYAGDVPNKNENFTGDMSRYCTEDSLDKEKAKGKIVLCDSFNMGVEQFRAGAVGTIMQDGGYKDVAFGNLLPATHLGTEDGSAILRYIRSTSDAKATIYKSIEEKDELAPFVPLYSARGPNEITKDILKPDLSAPGVDILAAWSEGTTMTGEPEDSRVVKYNIISGTSMACPHASGAAAFVKSFHMSWSPAAIRSALMTTAKPLSTITNPEADLAFGSGQIDPMNATKPGLVYDAGFNDYVRFLCGQGIGTRRLRLITGDNSTCNSSNNGKVWDLNYPSFTLSAKQSDFVLRVFHRTVTHVGSSASTYKAIVTSSDPSLLKIQVEPSVLRFKSEGEKKSFILIASAKIEKNIVSGSLSWEDGKHKVRSPIVAHSYA